MDSGQIWMILIFGCNVTTDYSRLGEPQADRSNQDDSVQSCIVSTLLYGSESWTTYAKQEQKLNSFHIRCLRHNLGISSNDKVPNAQVLARAGLPTMYQTALAMCAIWKTVGSPRTSSMVNSYLAKDPKVAPVEI
ncbi:hypothetical protein MHYP_G00062740 [Metynnis hypsauchen]